MNSKRNVSMDIIRTVASFFVIALHFFLNNGFYEECVTGTNMFIMITMRTFFMVCVPLFMMLSGYLLINKKPERSYYLKGIRILVIYVLSSLICALYTNMFKENTYNLSGIIGGILGFRIAPYSWYIEMYFGFFLLIPFLNIMYNNIADKKHKLILILTFIILTSLPSVVNIHQLSDFQWLSEPSSLTVYTQLIPQWWVLLYPLTYYFLGCYIREYGIDINKWINLILIILTGLVSSLFCWWRSAGNVFIAGAWCNWESLFNVALTVLIFVFFANRSYDKFPGWICRTFSFLSSVSLGAYLVSWVFDDAFYPILNSKIPVMTDRLKYFFLIVPAIYICSVIASWFMNSVYNILALIYKKIKGEIK